VVNFRLADLNVNAANLGALDASNPSFLNPTFLNPTFLNPSFLNPSFLNPTFLNPNFLNPNFLNPNFLNPSFLNPSFLNPTFLNPSFLNPSFLNGAPDPTITSMTWQTEASANTSSSYLFRALSTAEIPEEWLVQLLIYRLYFAPSPQGGGDCGVTPTVHHELITSVLNPTFLNPSFLNLDAKDPNFINAAESSEVANATYALNAGDKALITLQIVTPDGALTVEEAKQMISAIIVPESVNSTAAAAGNTTPAVSLTITTTAVPRVLSGVAYSAAFAAAGGTLPLGWSVQSGTLPAGLTLTPQGQLQGTTTAAGTYPVVIAVADAGTPLQTASRPFIIRVLNTQLLNGEFDGGLAQWTVLRNEATLQQGVVAAPAEFVPPLQGNAYNLRPGSESPGAGLSQIVAVTPGTAYDWSISIAAKETQSPNGNFPLGTFTLSLNGAVVATLAYTTTAGGSQTFTGTYTPEIDEIEFKLVFNRGLSSNTANPQWYADKAVLRGAPSSLAFVQQPSDAPANTSIAPAVQLKVLDASGGALPGVPVTLSLSSNPGDTSLSGTTSAVSDAAGNVSFANLQLGSNAAGYALTAAASSLSTVSNTFNIGSISFEMMTDGTPACNGCNITTQFASRGVVFSFGGAVDPTQTNVTLVNSTGIDPTGPANHSISNPGGPGGGFTGTMRMDFANSPSFVNFRLRGPSSGSPPNQTFSPFIVSAFDPSGQPIPSNQITRFGGFYSPSSACCGQYSEETLTITILNGVGWVTIGTGPRIIVLDNLRLAGGPIGNDEEQPAVVVPPSAKGAQR
jgi:hypothetical protein